MNNEIKTTNLVHKTDTDWRVNDMIGHREGRGGDEEMTNVTQLVTQS